MMAKTQGLQAPRNDGYVYVASPFTHPNPDVMEWRYFAALKYTQELLGQLNWAFTPIGHCYVMAKLYNLGHEHEFWLQYDKIMIDNAAGMHVLCIDGWKQSTGVQWEIEYWTRTRPKLPIAYFTPDDEWLAGVRTKFK